MQHPKISLTLVAAAVVLIGCGEQKKPAPGWFGDECDQPDVATVPKGTRVETPRPPGP